MLVTSGGIKPSSVQSRAVCSMIHRFAKPASLWKFIYPRSLHLRCRHIQKFSTTFFLFCVHSSLLCIYLINLSSHGSVCPQLSKHIEAKLTGFQLQSQLSTLSQYPLRRCACGSVIWGADFGWMTTLRSLPWSSISSTPSSSGCCTLNKVRESYTSLNGHNENTHWF